MVKEAKSPTRVFISYSWDSDEHKNRVLQLANTLRQPWGVEADIDQYVRAKPPFTPAEGWDLWMEKRIEWAEFVLVVCTETYKRRFRGDEEPGIGRGVTWEGTIIRQHLYNNQLTDTKFIPVVFSSQDLAYVPLILNSHDKYILTDEESFKMLGYRLRREPLVAMPEVAAAELSSPPKPVFFPPGKTSIEPPPVVTQIETLSNVEKATEEKAERERQIQLGQQRQIEEQEKLRQAELLSQQQAAEAARLTQEELERQRQEQIKREAEKKRQQEQAKQASGDALKGNYAQLEALLKAGKWREADEETATQMCQIMGRQSEGWLRIEDIEQFPCADLRRIDQLWVKDSNGKFGFSVQKKIWQQCGSPKELSKQWEKFGEVVGWRAKGMMGIEAETLNYSEFTFNTSAPEGHLPFWVMGGVRLVGSLLSRTDV